jgi:hypothetical protein
MNLIGRWKLIKFESQLPSGEVLTVTDGQEGELIYNLDGTMSVDIKRTDDVKSIDRRLADLTYSGKFEVKGNQVLHIVSEGNIPQMVGATLVRDANLEGYILKLSLGSIGSEGYTRLTWKKA